MSKSALVDLEQHEALETKRFELSLLNGDTHTGVFVELYGPASEQYANALLARDRRRAEIEADDTAAMHGNQAQFYIDVTKSFDGVGYQNKEGRELVEAIYRNRKFGYLHAQVHSIVNNWGNFLPNAASV
jgi:hypothetical protein